MTKCKKCDQGYLFRGNDGTTYCTDCDYSKEPKIRKRRNKDLLGHIFKI